MSTGEDLERALRDCKPLSDEYDDIEARLQRNWLAQLRDRIPEPVVVDHCVVLNKIGSGGMGRVFAAFDTTLRRRVAIKFLRKDVKEAVDDRLLREGQAMAQIDHPNVVKVYDARRFEGSVYIMMELVEGKTLRTWQEKDNPSASEILSVYEQAGKGLAAMHEAGFVHRDIKPENIFIDANGRVKVGDLGLVYAIREAESDGPTGQSTAEWRTMYNQTGDRIGTLAYMSPEQLLRKRVSATSDQFSFCVALWEALYGQRPFHGDEAPEMIDAMHRGAPILPRRRRGPAKLATILLRGLDLTPERRFSNMEELLEAIVAARRRRRIVTIWGGVGLGTVVALAMAFAWRSYDSCAGAGKELALVWKDRQPEIRQAIVALGTDPSMQAWQSFERSFEEAANAWKAQSYELCDDERKNRGDRGERRALQTCLNLQRALLVGQVSDADKDPIKPGAIYRTAEELRRIQDNCRGERLKAYIGKVLDKPTEKELLTIRRLIDDAGAEEFDGNLDAAEQLARNAVERARKLDIPLMRVSAHYRLGHILGQKKDFERADVELSNATMNAVAAHDAYGALVSWIYRAKLEAERARNGSCIELPEGTGGDRWLAMSLGLLQYSFNLSPDGDVPTSSGDRLLLADFHEARGLHLMQQLRHRAADEEFQRAYRLRSHDNTPVARLDATKSLNNLGNAWSCEAEYKNNDGELYKTAFGYYNDALREREALLGKNHPLVAQVMANLADAKHKAGAGSEAQALARSAWAIYKRANLLNSIEAKFAYQLCGNDCVAETPEASPTQ